MPNHKFASGLYKDQYPNLKFRGNEVKTTKYTLLTFLPKNLFEQVRYHIGMMNL